jgi:tetratricopeptide (TPR) repeat protein
MLEAAKIDLLRGRTAECVTHARDAMTVFQDEPDGVCDWDAAMCAVLIGDAWYSDACGRDRECLALYDAALAIIGAPEPPPSADAAAPPFRGSAAASGSCRPLPSPLDMIVGGGSVQGVSHARNRTAEAADGAAAHDHSVVRQSSRTIGRRRGPRSASRRSSSGGAGRAVHGRPTTADSRASWNSSVTVGIADAAAASQAAATTLPQNRRLLWTASTATLKTTSARSSSSPPQQTAARKAQQQPHATTTARPSPVHAACPDGPEAASVARHEIVIRRALVLRRLDHLNDARDALIDAIASRALPAIHPANCAAHCELGHVLRAQGRHADAAVLYRLALESLEAAEEASSAASGARGGAAGTAAASSRPFADGLALLRAGHNQPALSIGIEIAAVLVSLGRCEMALGRPHTALRSFLLAETRLVRCHGPTSHETAKIAIDVARALAQLGRPRDAVSRIAKAERFMSREDRDESARLVARWRRRR